MIHPKLYSIYLRGTIYSLIPQKPPVRWTLPRSLCLQPAAGQIRQGPGTMPSSPQDCINGNNNSKYRNNSSSGNNNHKSSGLGKPTTFAPKDLQLEDP